MINSIRVRIGFHQVDEFHSSDDFHQGNEFHQGDELDQNDEVHQNDEFHRGNDFNKMMSSKVLTFHQHDEFLLDKDWIFTS